MSALGTRSRRRVRAARGAGSLLAAFHPRHRQRATARAGLLTSQRIRTHERRTALTHTPLEASSDALSLTTHSTAMDMDEVAAMAAMGLPSTFVRQARTTTRSEQTTHERGARTHTLCGTLLCCAAR